MLNRSEFETVRNKKEKKQKIRQVGNNGVRKKKEEEKKDRFGENIGRRRREGWRWQERMDVV